MIYLIGYIVGAILTLIFLLWYWSGKARKLRQDDFGRIVILSILFPTVWIWVLTDALTSVANFMYCEMRKWRKKNDKK